MRKALVIGINDYPENPLRGCINDANEIADVLRTNGDGTPNFSVKKYTNIDTKGELIELITELFHGNPDASLLYFSGHGYIDAVRSCLVTPDFSKFDYGVSMDEILNIANQSHANHKIIILDCCYSGAFGSPKCTGGLSSQICEGVTILTASKHDEASVEVDGHGMFTNLLLAALRGGAADILGNITSGSVYSYIDRALGAWDQRPVFKTNISSFFPLRTTTPTIPLENLRNITKYFSKPQDVLPLDPSYEFTNTPDYKIELKEPYSMAEHITILKNLQKLERVGLVEPINDEHMYFAAMNSNGCKLTSLGRHYWKLVKDGLI